MTVVLPMGSFADLLVVFGYYPSPFEKRSLSSEKMHTLRPFVNCADVFQFRPSLHS